MLPGFRFLFAAIVLSMSILVCGLGAAALLRAAHEEFASNPSWRAAPEATFARPSEATKPVLAMLRVEPPGAEQNAPDQVPPVAAPAEPPIVVSAPTEPAASASTPAEPETIATLKSEDSPLQETAKPEIPVVEPSPQSESAPAQAEAPAPADETKITESEQISSPEQILGPANETAPTASEQASAPSTADADMASTKIATLGGPPVTIEEQQPAKAAGAKPDSSVIKKRRLQARRAAERRRMALRARLEAQQPANPFAQPVAADRKR
jgi:outer membrane biosynthesis protein TonB